MARLIDDYLQDDYYAETFEGWFVDDKPDDPYGNTQGPGVYIQSMVGPNASVASVKYDGLLGVGDAKRNKGERFSDEVGRDLAEARALRDLADQLEVRAYERLDA